MRVEKTDSQFQHIAIICETPLEWEVVGMIAELSSSDKLVDFASDYGLIATRGEMDEIVTNLLIGLRDAIAHTPVP